MNSPFSFSMITVMHSPNKCTCASLVKAGELLPSLFLCSSLSLSNPGAYRTVCSVSACSIAWWNTVLSSLTVRKSISPCFHSSSPDCQAYLCCCNSAAFMVSWIFVGSLKITFWPCIIRMISLVQQWLHLFHHCVHWCLLCWQGYDICHGLLIFSCISIQKRSQSVFRKTLMK